MKYSKEEYENLINSSRIFEIDKEKDFALYKTERYAFLTLLTDYYRFYVFPNTPLDVYDMVLLETAVECLKYYEKEKGEFLHLFNYTMKRNLSISKAKELQESQRQGITISRDENLKIRKIISFANTKGLDINDIAVQEKVAMAFNMSLQEVEELIRINLDAVAISDVVQNDDGEETSLFDTISSKEQTAEEKLDKESSLIDIFDAIEETYLNLSDRPTTKKIIAMLLTAKIIECLGGDTIQVKYYIEDRPYYSDEVVKTYVEQNNILSDKEIANICGVSQPSISRTFKNFIKSVKLKR